MAASARWEVPEVVGLPFHVAGDLATAAHVALANPDPDGPPISVLAWPGLFYITSQSPAPGTLVDEWASVAVEVMAHGDAADRSAAPPAGRPPFLQQSAEPEAEPELHHLDD